MSKPNNNKSLSIFQKVLEAGTAYLDTQIFKAKTTILNSNIEEDFFFGKAVTEDPTYSTHAQGYLDKPYRITNAHLKQMSYQDTAIAAVIQTRQNQVANHAKLVKSKQEKGFLIKIKDEDALLAKIKEELKLEIENSKLNPESKDSESDLAFVQKSEVINTDETSLEGIQDSNKSDNLKSDDETEISDFELERKAKAKLISQFEAAKKEVEDYILNCGKKENRPFETKKWNFEAALRAWTRDTLTYDIYATEKVPDRAGRPHHWFPADGGTIKKASKDLKKYKDMSENFFNIDILYPEKEEAKQRQKAIELDSSLLEKDAYKWVQVIKGRVERAYTLDELAVGIRNINTDIYNNGYGISELELLVSMVSGHLNAEYYNQAYFTQGFSAKGILHIKAALNRRKIESVRTDWHHMLKGARNSFQTPIFAGVEDVNWIPLTQNHNDIGFEGWMRYLVTMIGAIYQIDPAEMGIHFKDEGGGGSLSGKSNTKEKIDNSKDRGLFPVLSHFQNYINEEIIKPFDARFALEFTGVEGLTASQTLERQEKEAKFKKTLNEIRAEDGLPPLPGCDDLILSSEYLNWYSQFSPKAKNLQQMQQSALASQQNMGMDTQNKPGPTDSFYSPEVMNMGDQPFVQKSLTKSYKPVSIEVYKIENN